MPYNEADTRAKLIDPSLHDRGWTEDHIRREQTPGEILSNSAVSASQSSKGRTDYTLRLKVSPDSQPVAVAVIEAKAEDHHPAHGLQQAKDYIPATKRLNVPFFYSSNGHKFVEYDAFTGLTSDPRPMAEFPTPAELRTRYEDGRGFSLDAAAALPLLTPYPSGESKRRYYQDAAIRATLEKIASGGNRALLSLATGSGKTFIAVNLLKRIADAGQMRRALFVCDRDELRTQGLAAFQNEFGADAAAATTLNPERNARIVVATYQTLGVDSEGSDSSYLKTHYPEGYFSHIVIDECHRSAWGKWSEVLKRNADAVQIGLTATPRELRFAENSHASREDKKITADNLKYFGEPIYEYSINQGIEDGYLAAMHIVREEVYMAGYDDWEAETGVKQSDLEGTTLTDPVTGETISIEDAKEKYNAPSFEARLMIPERTRLMCADLFARLTASGKPEQKTIIFCARDTHADMVTNEMNNLYAHWCKDNGRKPVSDYAFKCTAAGGSDHLADLRGMSTNFFVAATVDLLTTGVDVPNVVNIVFFKYVASPIAFYQMVGRGTRLHPQSGKLMFTVYDYTNATRRLGGDFATVESNNGGGGGDPPDDSERLIQVEGIDVRINDAGTYILTKDDSGAEIALTLEEYKQRLASKLIEGAPNLDDFRAAWVEPALRQEMLERLPDSGGSPIVVKRMSAMDDYDLYDVIADLAYGLAPKTMIERSEAFEGKNRKWLEELPGRSPDVIMAIASQFAKGGTESLEHPHLFRTPEVASAGGFRALRQIGNPNDALRMTKTRMFAA